MKKSFSLDVNGSMLICEQYGDINNANRIILFCHGFPGSSRLERLYFNLKNKSISIVEINFRGDKRSEGRFSFLGSIKDIEVVANYLNQKFNVPLDVLGYSMGGLYVCNIINKNPHIFDKVVLLNPVVDSMALFSNKLLMDELWIHANNILSLNVAETYKDEISYLINDLNPIRFAEKLKSNIIIIQSTNDEVLDPKLAKKFYTLLNSKKSYHEIPNKIHGLKGDEKELLVLLN